MFPTVRISLSHTGWSGLAYTLIFLGLSWHWLAVADTSSGVGANAADEPLVVYILGWVRLALSTQPAQLFDAPINFPARLQLAGSEHLLSTQILFAPIYQLTQNNLLAANLTLFLTYPISALAMQRLLLALGSRAFPAFVIGLGFSLGPFQAPANLHLLQYLNLYLPLVALALLRLRAVPSAGRMAAFGLITVLALLSSYYTAIITAVGGGIWGLLELSRKAPERSRFLGLAAIAAGVAASLLLLISLPYFDYLELIKQGGIASGPRGISPLSRLIFANETSWVHLRLIFRLGLAALVFGSKSTRRCAFGGLMTVWVARHLAGDGDLFLQTLGIISPPSFSIWSIPGLEFFRYPFRFAILAGFGCALTAAAVLACARERLGMPIMTGLTIALALFIGIERGGAMSINHPVKFIDASPKLVQRIIEVTAKHGQGPILELPYLAPLNGGQLLRGGTEVRSMLRSLEHGMPLVLGHTGYKPRHRPQIRKQVYPYSSPSLQRLVDATSLRWILLRPPDQWSESTIRNRKAILRIPTLTSRASVDGWELLEVTSRPWSSLWIDSIRAGTDESSTALGTPLTALEKSAVRGSIQLSLGQPVAAQGRASATIVITNLGEGIWPATNYRRSTQNPFLVRAFAQWREISQPEIPDTPSRVVHEQALTLGWDLRPGEPYAFFAKLTTPPVPGSYSLALKIGQGEDGSFRSLGVTSAEQIIEVLDAEPVSPD
ncbi:MAG TPA: hypothetical protein DCG06_01575 [Deltaproteobacteria bacterium]|nr:hypothetical protein [Deltaproteobacteria bacterium]